MARELLERDDALARLVTAVRDASEGRSRIALVRGEAGIGKSSLIAAFRTAPNSEVPVLVGACDALSTPRTLGPLRDLAPNFAAPLAEALASGDREAVFAALVDELSGPTARVLVIEDAHWADEATLDVLRYLARRLDALRVMLVLTYRDDELPRDHPLVALIGDLPRGDRVIRMPLERLTRSAVETLASASAIDADEVYALTSGNPFFVAELVATADESHVPPTVVDAVLARSRRLEPAERDELELLAVVPSVVDAALAQKLLPGGVSTLRRAEERGLVTVRPDGVQFRHELTRRAIVDALPASRRIELNARVLEALAADPDADPGRLVHHAVEAGDVETLTRLAPIAADDAIASGAHRQAVAHLAVALEHDERCPLDRRAELWERYAIELYTIGRATDAVGVQRRAIALRRELPSVADLGLSLRWMSRFSWFAGDRRQAERAAEEATELLEPTGDPRLVAMALSNQAQLALLAHDRHGAIDLASRAAALAREANARSVLSHALTNLGSARLFLGDDAGFDDLLEAADLALGVNDMENAARAYVNLVWALLDEYELDRAEPYLDRAMALSERAEFIAFLNYQRGERSRLDLARANWDAALAGAERRDTSQPHARCVFLTVVASVYTRRGNPRAAAALDEARELADSLGELQRTGPVAAARAEFALLAGDSAAARAIAEPAYRDAIESGDRPTAAELAYRLRRTGLDVPIPPIDHPFAVQARGDWRGAADRWHEVGAPYHEAEALAESPNDDDLLEALRILDELGATPLAGQVRAELRRRGVEHIPRGPAVATRSNPHGLTGRQVDVLAALADGLTNAQIADRLVLSVRTVDSHVAAILAKLGVSTRREAVEVTAIAAESATAAESESESESDKDARIAGHR